MYISNVIVIWMQTHVSTHAYWACISCRLCQISAHKLHNSAICLSAVNLSRLHLKCDGTRAETRFRLSVKRTSPFKSAGASVQSATGSRGVRISGSDAGYSMFWGSVKSTGYPLHSPVSPSLPVPCVTVCHHVSTGLYNIALRITIIKCQQVLNNSPSQQN